MLNFNENKIAVSKQVEVEMTRLRSEASLKDNSYVPGTKYSFACEELCSGRTTK